MINTLKSKCKKKFHIAPNSECTEPKPVYVLGRIGYHKPLNIQCHVFKDVKQVKIQVQQIAEDPGKLFWNKTIF